jgi:peptidoglycan/LPS O-acetylase OafA/YrhL
MAVIAMHFSATMQENAAGAFPSLAPDGELAVDLFFVLSGFIMAYTYLPSFTEAPALDAYRQFLVKRAARILPLNFALTLFFIVTGIASSWITGNNLFPHTRPDWAVSDTATNSLMLPGLGIGHSVNWPAWSIAVEFVAYFLFPIFLAGIFGVRRRIFVIICLAAFSLLGAVCATGPHLSPDGMHNHPFPWRDLARCFSEFLLGIATYRLYRSAKIVRYFEWDCVSFTIAAIIVAMVVARVEALFILPCFPLLILALSVNKGWPARFLATKVPYFLGLISYSLYLVHDNFRDLAVHLVRYIHPAPLSPLLAMALAAGFSILMILPAWLSYVWVEHPGRVLFRSGARLEAKLSIRS